MAESKSPSPFEVNLESTYSSYNRFEWMGFTGRVSADMNLARKYDEELPSLHNGYVNLPNGAMRLFYDVPVDSESVHPVGSAALTMIDRLMNQV